MTQLVLFLSSAWQWFVAHAAQLATALLVLGAAVEALPKETRAALARDWPRLAHLASAVGALSPLLVTALRHLAGVATGAPHPLGQLVPVAQRDTDPASPRGSPGFLERGALASLAWLGLLVLLLVPLCTGCGASGLQSAKGIAGAIYAAICGEAGQSIERVLLGSPMSSGGASDGGVLLSQKPGAR